MTVTTSMVRAARERLASELLVRAARERLDRELAQAEMTSP